MNNIRRYLTIMIMTFSLSIGLLYSSPVHAKAQKTRVSAARKAGKNRKSAAKKYSKIKKYTTARKSNTAGKVTARTTSTGNLDQWLTVCSVMGANLNKRDFTYSYSCHSKSYKAALSGDRETNCAQYVSWCLQEYGIIKRGQTFHVSGGDIHKNFSHWDKSKVQIIQVYNSCSKAKLQPGDVVCWDGKAHTCIYAGRNKKGRRTWYDAGRQSTYGKCSGSRFRKVTAKTSSYLDGRDVAYIIRIKGL